MNLRQCLQRALQDRHVTDPDLVLMIEDIAKACKQIAVAINRGALTGSMGSLESENVQGETQKQLDVMLSNFKSELRRYVFLKINGMLKEILPGEG